MTIVMTPWQVKEARTAAIGGESIRSVSRRLRLKYQTVYQAVRGYTRETITNPPAVEGGVLKIGPRRAPLLCVCQNCGRKYHRLKEGGTTTRCNPCYTHWNRHGVERTEEHLHKHSYARLSRRELVALHRSYQNGASVDELAETLPFSAETLRRRFVDAGFDLRGNAGTNQKLTASLVRWARERVHVDGLSVKDVAQELGQNYQTVYGAVTGHTWRAAGGPLPEVEGEKRPCSVCEMLTAHESGKCRYCR